MQVRIHQHVTNPRHPQLNPRDDMIVCPSSRLRNTSTNQWMHRYASWLEYTKAVANACAGELLKKGPQRYALRCKIGCASQAQPSSYRSSGHRF